MSAACNLCSRHGRTPDVISSKEDARRRDQKLTAMSASVVNGPSNEDVYISTIHLPSGGNEKWSGIAEGDITFGNSP